MNRRNFFRVAGAAVAVALASAAFGRIPDSPPAVAAPARKPNIILILADDLGFETLGAYGGQTYQGLGPVKTPNLDAMARDGMRFTRCFATPVCSPARAELLTGRYNFRTGFIDIAGRHGASKSLDAAKFPTLATALRSAGYVTAVTGKWHLGEPLDIHNQLPPKSGEDSAAAHVRECGFDRQYIFAGAHLVEYGEPRSGDYSPDLFQKWALNFIESRRDQASPFFLYYAMPIPHVPLLPTPLNPDGPHTGPTDANANFPYLIEYMDRQVGEIIRKVREMGLGDDTLIIFTGDNGTQPNVVTQMQGGKSVTGGKGSMNDTGSWVPFIARWPGRIARDSTCERLVDFTDVLPTCLELAGAADKMPAGIDGISFAPQLSGRSGLDRPWTHVQFVNRYFARDQNWKLRENGELYDITNSPYEERLVPPASDTGDSKAARQRLQAVLDKLHPEGPPKGAKENK